MALMGCQRQTATPTAPEASLVPTVNITATRSPVGQVEIDAYNNFHTRQTQVALLPTHTATLTLTPGPSPTVTATPLPIPTNTALPVADRIWTHDDTLTLYTQDNRLCLLPANGVPVYLAESNGIAQVRVSGDHQMIAYMRTDNPDPATWGGTNPTLWVINADGGYERRLFGPEELRRWYPQPFGAFVFLQWEWMPFSHQLVLTSGQWVQGGYPDDLFLIDANSGSSAALLKPGDGGSKFIVAPNGKHIAVVKFDSISLIDPDGSNWKPSVLSYDFIYTYSETPVSVIPVWKPDSSGLWVAIPPQDPMGHPEKDIMQLWFIPADGSTPQLLRQFRVRIGFPLGNGMPVVSPDGHYVAVVTLSGGVDSELRTELHLIRADGMEDRLYYSPDSLQFQRWEADSRHFIFHNWKTNITYRGVIGGPYEPYEPPADIVPIQGCAPNQ